MTKSILKSDKGSPSGQPDGNSSLSVSAPVSVVVDVVNHDEPSVSSVMSNGAAASLHDNVLSQKIVQDTLHKLLNIYRKDWIHHDIGLERRRSACPVTT